MKALNHSIRIIKNCWMAISAKGAEFSPNIARMLYDIRDYKTGKPVSVSPLYFMGIVFGWINFKRLMALYLMRFLDFIENAFVSSPFEYFQRETRNNPNNVTIPPKNSPVIAPSLLLFIKIIKKSLVNITSAEGTTALLYLCK